MRQEDTDMLDSFFSYGIILRSPISEVQKLREFIKELAETTVVCENLTTKNQYLTTDKPLNRTLYPVINKEGQDEQ